MNLEEIKKKINDAFSNKDKIDGNDKSLNSLVSETIDLLDTGKIRVAEKKVKNGRSISGLKKQFF